MTDDFEFYQGDDIVPYFAIFENTGAPVDLSGWSAATWVATPLTSRTPIITKHKSDMTLGTDPTEMGATVENCIYIHITPADTENMMDIGQFRHELRIKLGGFEMVVYPPVGTTATFKVVESLTWDAGATPPAPRLERLASVEPLKPMKPEEPQAAHQLKRPPRGVR